MAHVGNVTSTRARSSSLRGAESASEVLSPGAKPSNAQADASMGGAEGWVRSDMICRCLAGSTLKIRCALRALWPFNYKSPLVGDVGDVALVPFRTSL